MSKKNIMIITLFMAICLLTGSVNAQFTEEEDSISNGFVIELIEQVNGYLILSDYDDNFMKWLIGLNENHDFSCVRWQINNMLMKNTELSEAQSWSFSESMDSYVTQIVTKQQILFTVSFSEQLNGFVVLSHGKISQDGNLVDN